MNRDRARERFRESPAVLAALETAWKAEDAADAAERKQRAEARKAAEERKP